MNVFILTDLEGIAGINTIEQMNREGEEYASSRQKLTENLNRAIDTCIKSGAENVYFLDGHGGGGNVYDELVDQRAEKCTIAKWQELSREGKIDCQIELGAHTRAGTIGGFLDHTLSSTRIFYIKVNGREMSEVALHATLCGKYGVPVIAVLGDEAACMQAKEYMPDIYTGTLKKANCRNHAHTFANADEILVSTIEKALANYKNVPLYKVEEPAEIEICYYRTDMCEEAIERKNGDVERIDARRLKKTVEKIMRYEDFKF